MPIGDNEKKTMYLITGGGQRIPFDGIVHETPLTYTGGEAESGFSRDIEPMDFTCSFRLKRISRKEFVSRLKKRGWTKKEAKIIARDANRRRTPYAVAWVRYMFGGSPVVRGDVVECGGAKPWTDDVELATARGGTPVFIDGEEIE